MHATNVRLREWREIRPPILGILFSVPSLSLGRQPIHRPCFLVVGLPRVMCVLLSRRTNSVAPVLEMDPGDVVGQRLRVAYVLTQEECTSFHPRFSLSYQMIKPDFRCLH